MAHIDFGTSAHAEGRRGLERIGSFCLLALAFFLPVFFVPALSFPFQFSKALLLSLFVLVIFSLWVVARLKDGEFVIPSSPLYIALGVIVGLVILSGLSSGSATLSLFGQGFEVGTALNILIVSLLAFLVPIMFRTKEQIFGSYLAFLASFFLLALFHLFRLVFGPDFLSVGIFTETVSNTIGKWNDLGVFFGVSALLSLVTIEFLSLGRLFKMLVYLAMLISLFFLAIVNFSTVWFVLGLFSLIFLVYLISFSPTSALAGAAEGDADDSGAPRQLRRIPAPSLIMLLISVVFIMAGNTIGGEISSALKISQIEARPSWGATFDVARQTLIKDPLLGAGPNGFTGEWLKYKPAGINGTVFWNTDFSYGVGLIPTFLATTGILGVMAWVAFFLLFLYSGFKAIQSSLADKFSQYLITSSFLVSLFLWIFSVFYIPSITIFALTFLFTGLFIASLTAERMSPSKSISFVKDPRAGFISVLLLILLLIGSVTLGYALTQKYVASVLFQKGVISFNTEGSLDKAEGLIVRAANMSPADIHFRFLTEMTLMRINALLSDTKRTATDASAARIRCAPTFLSIA